MIIHTNWAFGHLPKTGGDAAAAYLAALIPSCQRDDPSSPHKHDPFWVRSESHGKTYYLLGLRRLEAWTWSLMHEFNSHPSLLQLYGVPDAATSRFALSRPFADEYLLSLSQGVRITHWLRQEELLSDVLRFATECIGPVPVKQERRLKMMAMRPGRRQVQPFSAAEIDGLHRLNPHWSRRQSEVYA